MTSKNVHKGLLMVGILASALEGCDNSNRAGPAGFGGGSGGSGSGSGSGGGSGGSSGKKCIEDTECPSGQGCFRGEEQVSYCSPLCTRDSQCPDQIDCPSSQPKTGDKSCKEVGLHKDQGVCLLYTDVGYDADNCKSVVLRCLSDVDSCYCYMYVSPGNISQCTPTTYPNSTCCADESYPQEGLCMCYQTSFGCEPGMHKVNSCS
jgi:hypothetical protein